MELEWVGGGDEGYENEVNYQFTWLELIFISLVSHIFSTFQIRFYNNSF